MNQMRIWTSSFLVVAHEVVAVNDEQPTKTEEPLPVSDRSEIVELLDGLRAKFFRRLDLDEWSHNTRILLGQVDVTLAQYN